VVWQYWGMLEEGEKPSQEMAPEDETFIWKTYIDKENGYEIKYPGNWRMTVYEKPHELAQTKGAVRWFPPWVPQGEIKLVIEINVIKNLEEYSIPMMFVGLGKDIACENVEINGLTFCKLIKKSEKSNVADILIYAVSKDNEVYSIGIYNWLPESEVQTEFEIFNEMVSTFRFIE